LISLLHINMINIYKLTGLVNGLLYDKIR